LIKSGSVTLVDTLAGDDKEHNDEGNGDGESTTPQQEEGLVNTGRGGGSSGRLGQLEGSVESLETRQLFDKLGDFLNFR
jgi:hypothetical protein